jgi:hypothetical protein
MFMAKYLSIRWQHAGLPHQKPHPLAGYSVHADIDAASSFTAKTLTSNPAIEPALSNPKFVLASEFDLNEDDRLAHRVQTQGGSVWLSLHPQDRKSPLMDTLRTCLRQSGSEHNLRTVSVPKI